MLKQCVKKFIPRLFLSAYHKALAIAANIIYWFPSHQLITIGVTGTKGKSSTVIMITRILEEAGFAVGSMNTVFFKIGGKEWQNNKKQGMLGRFALQKMLRAMVRKKCTHAVIEVTSEGVAQHRHWGIAFDVLVFTNLTPEHIESHGSYERYRAAKQLVFRNLSKTRRKTIGGSQVKKVIIANAEDAEASQFLKFKADEKWSVSSDPACLPVLKNNFEAHLCADEVKDTEQGASLSLEGRYIQLPFHGAFMARNALLAIAASRSLGVALSACEQALENMGPIPGRVEMLKTKSNATVIIDYAHEPQSFEAIFKLGRSLAGAHRVISVFGATGGGRDAAKRPVMGALAGCHSDIIILTTDDPYDDDPQAIINDILPGIAQSPKKWNQGKNLWSIVDRAQAIKRSLALAQSGDIVLLLGKGSEPVMAVAHGKHVPWSDRSVVESLTS
ncbi:MAG: UDP-N-acetylmuramyl-tripeptide synthetase [Parcubacteria group bacterium]|nr:UDP-N-acetylmuramyl-tripeptide synthetase [Parcubacteria group bacterium]